MTKIFIPAGKISAKKREFRSIVADVRHAVFSVIRQRPVANGQFQTYALGSGFFVSSSVFITCWHVIDDPRNPHQPGDQYVLMNNLDGSNGITYLITGGLGKDIHLFPSLDFAIILCNVKPDQAFLPISYEPPRVGSELGVAGYPLASISVDANGSANIKGLVYRVAKGVATAVYNTNWDSGDGQPLTDVQVVEVNFFFVPGNSGGPVFDGETGRAFGYVKGLQTPKIHERLEKCTLLQPTPTHIPTDYIAGIHAVYSVGLMLDRVRTELEKFGVKL